MCDFVKFISIGIFIISSFMNEYITENMNGQRLVLTVNKQTQEVKRGVCKVRNAIF